MTEVSIKPLSIKRFNALAAYIRNPAAALISTELAWYSNEEETILGLILFDTIDEDYISIVLGPDESRRFRAIEVENFSDKDSAIDWLMNSIKWHTCNSLPVIPQGDKRKAIDLFAPVVKPEKQHIYFRRLMSDAAFTPAKEIIRSMMPYYVDIDGNFAEQFQSTGFDARVWELCLYAYLIEEEFVLEREHNAPDFTVTKYGKKVAIEAVTVGRKPGNTPQCKTDISAFKDPSDILDEHENRMPIRFGSPLFTKLQKSYWKLPHVLGNPIVFAIADFHDDMSMTWSSTALANYLYGHKQDFHYNDFGELVIVPKKINSHKKENKEIPSGFFSQPSAENISAVLFSASGTISKFTRMGRQAGFKESNSLIRRVGYCYDHDPNAASPKKFDYQVDENSNETWGEGFSMFHNPNALHPISEDLFPSIAHHYFKNGLLVSRIPNFHPFSSLTLNTSLKK